MSQSIDLNASNPGRYKACPDCRRRKVRCEAVATGHFGQPCQRYTRKYGAKRKLSRATPDHSKSPSVSPSALEHQSGWIVTPQAPPSPPHSDFDGSDNTMSTSPTSSSPETEAEPETAASERIPESSFRSQPLSAKDIQPVHTPLFLDPIAVRGLTGLLARSTMTVNEWNLLASFLPPTAAGTHRDSMSLNGVLSGREPLMLTNTAPDVDSMDLTGEAQSPAEFIDWNDFDQAIVNFELQDHMSSSSLFRHSP